MKSLTIGLRALSHPLTLLSISVLLLNDHLLKAASPNVLTGKLSDFAGLFFFPFLLIALLSLPLERFRLQPRHIAALAFGGTAIGFSLIKTTFWANILMVSGMEKLLGLPVQIIQDPTDLIALVVLWPAWLLWKRMEQLQSRQSAGKLAYFIMGLASIASVASAVCHYSYNIERLVSHGNDIYAASREIYAAPKEYVFVRSQDGGQSWDPLSSSEDLPPQVLKTFEQDLDLPKVLCAPENPQMCYRVAGKEMVEASNDGGESWQIVWEIPAGRRQYMQRVKNLPGPPNCGSVLNIGPHDIAILAYGNTHIAVVAMGTQGVVVRSPDGIWQRFSVINATPIPYQADNIIDAMSPFPFPLEFGLLFAGSILVLLGFNIWGLIRGFKIQRSWPTLALGGCILFATAYSIYLTMRYGELYYPLMHFAAAILLTIIWIVISLVRKPKEVRKIGGISFLIAAGAFMFGWLPFALWALGVIPHYWIALVISICLVILTIGLGRQRMIRILHS